MFDSKSKSPAKMFFMFVVLAPIFIALYGFAVQYLWNWLLPDIVGATEITFWQALGLIALSKLLFGFGRSGGGKHKCGHKSHSWKSKMKDKFANMSEEERAQCCDDWNAMKARWKNKDKDDGEDEDGE